MAAGYKGSQDVIEDVQELLKKEGVPFCLITAMHWGSLVTWDDGGIEQVLEDGSRRHMLYQMRTALDNAIAQMENDRS